jgi:hypothetical protein
MRSTVEAWDGRCQEAVPPVESHLGQVLVHLEIH